MSRKQLAAMLCLPLVLLTCVFSVANAELTERGDLFVKFDGDIVPHALPRQDRAPITVRIGGVVRTLSGKKPPSLRRITIAINRNGTLDTEGLPRCPRSSLEGSSSQRALELCRRALVGRGRYTAQIAFPEQGSFPSSGRILAFNAVEAGHRAIFAHVYGSSPPIARIIAFHFHFSTGTFGTVLVGTLPKALNRYGYIEELDLVLHRTYSFGGQRHSYLGATCAAPTGLPGAVFPFARTSMTFADGRELSSTLIRSCRVRGR